MVEGTESRRSPPSIIMSTSFSKADTISEILFRGGLPLLFTLVETIGTPVNLRILCRKSSSGTRSATVPPDNEFKTRVKGPGHKERIVLSILSPDSLET